MRPSLPAPSSDLFRAELPAPTRRWCFGFHQWWSPLHNGKWWGRKPDRYFGSNPPTTTTCLRCGKTRTIVWGRR